MCLMVLTAAALYLLPQVFVGRAYRCKKINDAETDMGAL